MGRLLRSSSLFVGRKDLDPGFTWKVKLRSYLANFHQNVKSRFRLIMASFLLRRHLTCRAPTFSVRRFELLASVLRLVNETPRNHDRKHHNKRRQNLKFPSAAPVPSASLRKNCSFKCNAIKKALVVAVAVAVAIMRNAFAIITEFSAILVQFIYTECCRLVLTVAEYSISISIRCLA